jgi:hypothetical protein
MVRGEPEHGFERDVPVKAPIVSEDKLVEIRVEIRIDVLAAQPMIGAEPPTLQASSGAGRVWRMLIGNSSTEQRSRSV